MPTYVTTHDDDDDDDDDDRDGDEDHAADDSGEWSSDSFDDDGDSPDVVPCPYCGREISEDAEQCPKCRNYISREDAPAERKPGWVILIVVILVLMFSGVLTFLLSG